MPPNHNTTSRTIQLFKHHFYILKIAYSLNYLIRFAEKNGIEETVYFRRVDVSYSALNRLRIRTKDTAYTPMPFNGVKYEIYRLQEDIRQPIKGYMLCKIKRNGNEIDDRMPDVLYYICEKVESR